MRSGPASGLCAISGPNDFAGLLVEGKELGASFVVPRHYDFIVDQGRRASFTKPVANRHIPEVFFPNQLAIDCVAVEALRSKVSIDMFPVGAGGSRCVGVRFVRAFVGRCFNGRLLPKGLPGLPIEAEDLKGELATACTWNG